MSQTDNNETANAQDIRTRAEELISGYLTATSSLYWQINVVKNKIRYFNHYRIPGLGDNTCRILQDTGFSRNVIFEQDFTRFERFMETVKKRERGSVLIRIKADDGTVRWLKISGWPDPFKSSCCFGMISEETDLVNSILISETDESLLRKKVAFFSNPVIIAGFRDKKIIMTNTPALSSFNCTDEEICGTDFTSLLSGNEARYLQRIYESLIFNGRWSGDIIFKDKNGDSFSADTVIRPFSDTGKNMLWISLQNITGKKSRRTETGKRGQDSIPLQDTGLDMIGKSDDIHRILSLIIQHQPIPGLADALMYSSVSIEANRVSVYGTGRGFENLTQGSAHPFKGSIAENIISYQLDHLILSETSESIKPIDWALFIPMGVRSYFAKPFYEEGALKTVLIFCSSETARFSEENVKPYDSIYPAFLDGLSNWKKSRN